MSGKLQMTTRTRFGGAHKAQLNKPLMDALAAAPDCDTCVDILQDVEASPDGGEFVEAASFPGRTVQKLDAHFRGHWKDEYELVDLSVGRP